MRANLILATLILVGCSTASTPPANDNSLPAPSTAHVTFEGGNGTSCDDLIVVKGAANESEGVHAEYEWIDRHFPGAKRGGQGLGGCSTIADVVTITTAAGEERKIYFDI